MKNSVLLKKAIDKGLRVGYCDIETSPYISMHYGERDLYIGFDQMLVETRLTSAVLMDEKSKEVVTYEWDWQGPYQIDHTGVSGGGDDSKFMKEMSKKLQEFDIVVMQNGDRFDLPVVQFRLYQLGLPPIKNMLTIDTLKLSRKVFKAPSHKLDYQGKLIGARKIKQGMDEAMAVALGHKKQSEYRLKYNIKDVTLMRDVFWSRINYYDFPKKLTMMLSKMVEEKPIFCAKCATRRQKRFDVEILKEEGVEKDKWRCMRCMHTWKMRAGEREAYRELVKKRKQKFEVV